MGLLDRFRQNKGAPPTPSNSQAATQTVTTVQNWFRSPLPAYTPLSDVAFGEMQAVIPPGPPMGPMIFPNPQANKMLNMPSVRSVYGSNDKGQRF